MLYRRPNSNNYWCRFTAPNGKEVRRTTKTTNKKAAQEFEAKLKSEFWRVQHLGNKQRRSWQEATIRWLQETAHKKTHEDDVIVFEHNNNEIHIAPDGKETVLYIKDETSTK
mgnify:CR=1 FL=1